MPVLAVPCLSDNYAYVVHATGGKNAVVIDPSEAAPVRKALEEHGLRLSVMLLTHHHWDHVGGVPSLLEWQPEVAVFCHEGDCARIRAPSHGVADGASIETPAGAFHVMHVPGHTLGAVAYHHEDQLFTGDTLFGGGCGRLFEGTAAQMFASLSRLARLSATTHVFPGHEYTLANLNFAAHLEPDNVRIQERLARVRALLDGGQGSVPSTLAEELDTNPFLRCEQADFLPRHPGRERISPVDLFAEIRRRKDTFHS
ncbi:MAG: hydroxyacylglutathione hydrolase [Polyangiaceae bacterium]